MAMHRVRKTDKDTKIKSKRTTGEGCSRKQEMMGRKGLDGEDEWQERERERKHEESWGVPDR